MRNPRERKRGAALIESCLVMIMLCLILFGILQLSYLVGARDVIAYASVGAARSATVGSDNFMLWKATRMITIPTAGPMVTPSATRAGADVYGDSVGAQWDYAVRGHPGNEQYWTEKYLLPFFLGSETMAESETVLNYANWKQTVTHVQAPVLSADERLEPDSFVDSPLEVSQYVPLEMPFARAFFRENMYSLWRADGAQYEVPHAKMSETAGIENHAAYYMQAYEE